MRKKVNWVLDADIRDFFGSLKHEWLIKFVEHRIADRRSSASSRMAEVAFRKMEDGRRRR